jgi:uncharacterized protein YecT (DUF1311 family)
MLRVETTTYAPSPTGRCGADSDVLMSIWYDKQPWISGRRIAGHCTVDAMSRVEISARGMTWCTTDANAWHAADQKPGEHCEFAAASQLAKAVDTKAYPDSSPDIADCAGTGAEMAQCAGDASRRTDKRLNEVYQAVLSKIESAKIKARLRDAQRAWISFRDRSCLYENGTQEEVRGTSWSWDQATCETAFAKDGIKQLEEYLQTCETHGC